MNYILLVAYLSGLTGSILLWFFGLPQKDISKDGHIHLILEQEDKPEKEEWKKFNKLSKLGIFFIGISFLLQILDLFKDKV